MSGHCIYSSIFFTERWTFLLVFESGQQNLERQALILAASLLWGVGMADGRTGRALQPLV